MATPYLALPPWVAANLEKEQFVEQQIEMARIWETRLKSVNPDLSVVWVKDTWAAKEAGLEPGRWHFKSNNRARGTADSYFPIVTETGGYREPVEADLDRLGQRDLWRTPHALAKMYEQREREERQVQHDKELRAEQRRDDFAADYRAAKRVAGEDPERKRWGRGGIPK